MKRAPLGSIPLALLLAACAGTSDTRAAQTEDTAATRIAQAAESVLQSLDDTQRAAACHAFDDAERMKWDFVPARYPGVLFGDLSPDQLRGVHRLLGAALSASGYHKTTTIIALEDTLREMAEAEGRKAPHRDPGLYSLAFFGEPSATAPWGFRLQGHHVSWNFSSVDQQVVATPAFLGANPAEVRQGPHAGLRALPDEEDVARELLATLSDVQRGEVIVDAQAPGDVFWARGRTREELGEPVGLRWSAMTTKQRVLLWRLIETYANNLAPDLARVHLDKIVRADLDGIRFAWMGSTVSGEGHYYRVQGPTFVIEYDNVQNDANHVHTVWHDLTDDFAVDRLRQHYERHHTAADG